MYFSLNLIGGKSKLKKGRNKIKREQKTDGKREEKQQKIKFKKRQKKGKNCK